MDNNSINRKFFPLHAARRCFTAWRKRLIVLALRHPKLTRCTRAAVLSSETRFTPGFDNRLILVESIKLSSDRARCCEGVSALYTAYADAPTPHSRTDLDQPDWQLRQRPLTDRNTRPRISSHLRLCHLQLIEL